MGKRLRASATTLDLPSRCIGVKLNDCSVMSHRMMRLDAVVDTLRFLHVRRLIEGILSEKRVNCVLRRYGRNSLTAQTTARSSFSHML